jgi:hypothetical protein
MNLREALWDFIKYVASLAAFGASLWLAAVIAGYFWPHLPFVGAKPLTMAIGSISAAWFLWSCFETTRGLWRMLRAQHPERRMSLAQGIAAVTSIAPLFQHNAAFNSVLSATALALCALFWSVAMTIGHEVTYAKRGRPYVAFPVFVGMFIVYVLVMALWYRGMSWASLPMSSLSTMELRAIPFLTGSALLILGFVSWRSLRGETASKRPIGRVAITEAEGLPVVTWSQLAGASGTEASADARGRFGLYIGFVAICALAGLLSGSIEGMVLTTIVGAWLGLFGLRGAGSLTMQGDVLRPVTHSKTDDERREEVSPNTQREDCEAYVEIKENELFFCLKRGDLDAGPLPVVERVPLESFDNFEEGSHREWFRDRISTSEVKDWGVIIAQSRVGRVLCVAESVRDRVWLVELLAILQRTFVENRPALTELLTKSKPFPAAPRLGASPGPTRPPSASQQAGSSSVPRRKF